MKNLLSKLCHIQILFVIPFVFIISTAETCDGFEVGGDGAGVLRTDIKKKYPETYDFKIETPPFFRYDLSEYGMSPISNGVDLSFDLNELMDYQNVYRGGGWLDFFSLFYYSQSFSGTHPHLDFTFRVPDCEGKIVVPYNDFDEKLCNERIVCNAPKIKAWHEVKVSVNTIKTTMHNMYISWKTTYPEIGYDATLIIDQQGTTNVSTSYVKYGNFNSKYFASARLIEDGRLVLIENTVASDLEKGDYSCTPVSEKPLVSENLRKYVCIDGEVSTSTKWAAPESVKLAKL